MNVWPSGLSGSWFVVAQSRQIGCKPLAVTLLDRPLVIARSDNGALFALNDCCPHRHVPLSLGRITRHGLQCPYHGWTFDKSGQCVSIPGQMPDANLPPVQVGAVDVMEFDGLVWVRLQGADNADAAALPGFLRRLSAYPQRFMWQSTWKARAIDALENFLDAQHTHFVHAGIVRRPQRRRTIEATVSRSAGAMQVDYRGQPDQSGLLYRLFESPRDLERAHFNILTAGTAQLEYHYRNGSALYFTLHFSPVSEWLTRVHGTLHVENRWAPRWAVRFFAWPLLRRVLHQDQAIVEALARNRQHFQPSSGVSTELDIVRPSLDRVWSNSRRETVDSVQTVRMRI